MITVGMNYHVREGKNEPFEKMFAKVIAALNEAPGHDNSNLFRDVTDAQNYLIMSQWNDRDAFEGFIRSDEFKKVTNWGDTNILDRRPSHDIY